MSQDGSMLTGACVLEHADRIIPAEWCDQEDEGHEYGSMQTRAIYFEKNMTFDFFQFAWNGEQGINYLSNNPVMDNIFV